MTSGRPADAGGWHSWRLRGTEVRVAARQLDRPMILDSLMGMDYGQAGDWLVKNAHDELHIVPAEQFDVLYEYQAEAAV